MRPLPDEAVPLLERFSDEVREVMLALRTRILKAAPRAHEVITDVGYTVALRIGYGWDWHRRDYDRDRPPPPPRRPRRY